MPSAILERTGAEHPTLARRVRVVRVPLDPKRTVAELKELRELTGDENGAQRVAWTETWERAREMARGLVAETGAEESIDAAGNQWFTLAGESERAVLIGGHIDSVPNGGWLDGCLNVVAGVEVLRRDRRRRERRPSRSGSSTGPTRRARASAAASSARARPPARWPTRTSCAS